MERGPATISLGVWIAGALFAAVVVFLFLSAVSSRRFGFEVCMAWKGREACGKAWASDQAGALKAARDMACGQLARGLPDRMACNQAVPLRQSLLSAAPSPPPPPSPTPPPAPR